MADDAVAFLREVDPAAADLAVWTRARVLDADPDLTERVYRGWRGVGFGHPEAGYVCGVFPRAGAVELLFEHGASLVDPDGVLRGVGTQTRVLPVTAADETTARTIRAYVQQAVFQRLGDRDR